MQLEPQWEREGEWEKIHVESSLARPKVLCQARALRGFPKSGIFVLLL